MLLFLGRKGFFDSPRLRKKMKEETASKISREDKRSTEKNYSMLAPSASYQ